MKRPVLASPRSWPQVFGVPILLALLSIVGLLSALLGDELWDAVSWLALGVPCALMAWFWFFAGRASEKRVNRPRK